MTGHESLSCAETSIEHTRENSQYSKYLAKRLSFHLCPRLQLLRFAWILSWEETEALFGPLFAPFKTKYIVKGETLDFPAGAKDRNLAILL